MWRRIIPQVIDAMGDKRDCQPEDQYRKRAIERMSDRVIVRLS